MNTKIYTKPEIIIESLFTSISLLAGSGLRSADEKGKDIGLIYSQEGNEDARSNGSSFDTDYNPTSPWE